MLPIAPCSMASYARYLQKAVGTTGHLFERRYHAVLILKPHQHLHTVRYVHLNPVRAGLVASPDDYPWSSHRCYLGTLAKPWVDADAVLASLASERGEAQRAFAEFCGEALRQPESMEVACDLLRRSGLPDASPGETSHKSLETLDRIVREVCECHGVSEARLMAQGKNHWLSAVRAEIAVRATAGGGRIAGCRGSTFESARVLAGARSIPVASDAQQRGMQNAKPGTSFT